MHGYSFRQIISAAALVALMTGVFVSAALWKMRDAALEEAEQGVAGLASLLAEQAQQSAQAIDLAMNEVEATLAAEGAVDLRAAAGSAATQRALANIADRRTSIDLISVDDAGGATIVTSRGGAAGASANPQVDALRASGSRETLIGAPRVSEATGELVVDFSRRLQAADGAYAGGVRISVKPKALVSAYSTIEAMPGRSYALFARDGTILLRYPDRLATGGRLPSTSQWYGVVAQGGGTYRADSAIDGQPRLMAVRPLPFSQLVVTVSIARAQALAHWRQQSLALLVCAVVALLIAAFLARALMVQLRRVADKERVLRAQSRELELANGRFRTALENMSQGLVVFDAHGRVVISNRRYATTYGLDPAAITQGMEAEAVLRLRAANGVYAGRTPENYIANVMSRRFNDQRVDHLSNGRSVLVSHAVCPEGGIVVTHEDVTEREQAGARIAHMALHDALTGLDNRALFLQTLEALREATGPVYAATVVMLIDLDDFKPVNDAYGHLAGDAVLRQCAERLRAAEPEAQAVARLGGDEFAIALGVAKVDDPDLLKRALRLIEAIAEPYWLDGQRLEVGGCLGVAIHEDATLSIDDMLRRADLALYAAKAEGSNRLRVFEPHMELAAITRRELATDLATAIERGDLHIDYQPIVDSDTLQIHRMEALVRWRHPRKGVIPAQEFIALAEETRLIDRLGRWVLQQACADAVKWPKRIGVSVNVSPLQLCQADFASSVLEALGVAGLSPWRLELEITESVLLQDRGGALAALHRLRERGISIALDDFGTGFSSMSYLKRFPFDVLKIERSFVADISRNAGSAAIVAATVQLGRAFGIRITAEGVETYEQYQAMRAAGVRSMQGYLFGRPDDIDAGLPKINAAVSIAAAPGSREARTATYACAPPSSLRPPSDPPWPAAPCIATAK